VGSWKWLCHLHDVENVDLRFTFSIHNQANDLFNILDRTRSFEHQPSTRMRGRSAASIDQKLLYEKPAGF
jgi:hypothetical protein